MKPRDGIWCCAPEKQRLFSKEVHVWRAELNKPKRVLPAFEKVLSKGEIKRADRFHFERDRRRYIVKHAILRIILGHHYLNCKPQSLRFGTNRYGKPYLKRGIDRDAIFFNLTDSNDLALYAFARNSEIGIDIECLRTVHDADGIAAQLFSKAENMVFQALPQSKKQSAFFNCWTRKEAFIKATGWGLNYPLNRFVVSIAPQETARLISLEGDFQKADEWSLVSMVPMNGYTGALAVKVKKLSVKFWTYPD